MGVPMKIQSISFFLFSWIVTISSSHLSWAENRHQAGSDAPQPGARANTAASSKEAAFKEIPKDKLPELGDLAGLLEKGAVIFSMQNCPACDELARKLTEKGIPFKKIRIASGQDSDTPEDNQNLQKYRATLQKLYAGQRFLFPGVIAPGFEGGVRVYSGNPLFSRAPAGADKIFDQITPHH